MKAEKGNSEESDKTPGGPGRKYSRSSIVALVIVLAIIVSVLVYNSRASAPTPNSNGGGTIKVPNLSLSPSGAKVPLSSSLAVKIWADSGDQKVNAVQANLSYPIDKFNFVNVDGTSSAFGLAVKGDGANGKVTIARGSFQPIAGKLLVATVNFTGANSQGEAAINFTSGTALLSATNNKDVLAGTYGGHYSLTQ